MQCPSHCSWFKSPQQYLVKSTDYETHCDALPAPITLPVLRHQHLFLKNSHVIVQLVTVVKCRKYKHAYIYIYMAQESNFVRVLKPVTQTGKLQPLCSFRFREQWTRCSYIFNNLWHPGRVEDLWDWTGWLLDMERLQCHCADISYYRTLLHHTECLVALRPFTKEWVTLKSRHCSSASHPVHRIWKESVIPLTRLSTGILSFINQTRCYMKYHNNYQLTYLNWLIV
jgi:hypothetical protein